MSLSYPHVERPAWTELDREAYDEVWDRFDAIYKFHPSGGRPEPVIQDPTPSITFDLTYTGSIFPNYHAINAEAMRCFVNVLHDVDHLIVLDWQHPTYLLDHRREVEEVAPQHWHDYYPTVYPNGDYYAFLTPELTEGTFGHPWEPSLCVIGQRLVDTLGVTLATWLPVKRRVDAR